MEKERVWKSDSQESAMNEDEVVGAMVLHWTYEGTDHMFTKATLLSITRKLFADYYSEGLGKIGREVD